jgi:hypothetical protein
VTILQENTARMQDLAIFIFKIFWEDPCGPPSLHSKMIKAPIPSHSFATLLKPSDAGQQICLQG